MSAEQSVLLCPTSDAYARIATELRALNAAVRLDADGDRWVRIGRYEFRGRSSGWEAKTCWGRCVYAVPVAAERDAVALALGLACFTSRSAGRGKRTDIKLVWRDR